MLKDSVVTVIIPVKNEEEKIITCIKSIADNNATTMSFIVIDDNSDDETFNNVQTLFSDAQYNGEVYHNDQSFGVGAGGARNLGMSKIAHETKYVLFFDGDDTMPNGALDKLVVQANNTDCDVVVAKYDYIKHSNPLLSIGMNRNDNEIWKKVAKDKNVMSFDIEKYGFFLEMVNYPWNKLIRYSYLKGIDLHFSCTPVHNDIFAHWQVLMNSKKITLVNTSICNHFVLEGNNQITNIADSRRLVIFDVLRELEELIINNSRFFELYYHFFLKFKLSLLKWAKAKFKDNEELLAEFNEKVRESYSLMDHEFLFSVAEKMPNIAAETVYFKLGMKKI